jgi:hypothetical protein
LIIVLIFVLAGTIWIDAYDVPHGLRSFACDFRVTSWHGILTSPKFYFALPILIAELAFWVRLLVWLWPAPALARTVASDWMLVALVFLIGSAITFSAVAALQPAPWNACLK